MDYLKLLRRNDCFEISGNRMTSYSSTLGGGSLNYWDGKRVSFNPCAPLCNVTAVMQVLDAKNRMNLLQTMYHHWQPDKITAHYQSHARTYVTEDKTIYDDTFVSKILFQSEVDVDDLDLIAKLEGMITEESSMLFQNNKLIIEEKKGKSDFATEGEYAKGKSLVYKVIGFDIDAEFTADGNKYALEFALFKKSADERLKKQSATLIVAAADTQELALEKFEKAIKNPEELFRSRKEEMVAFFENNVPKFQCDNPEIQKMYYYIWYMEKSNIYEFGEGYFREPFVSTGKFRLLPQWFWDSAFGAINEKWLNDMAIPKSAMINMLNSQKEDGQLPFTLCLDEYTYGDCDVIQPFILPLAVWDYYLKSGDNDFIAKALPVLMKFDDWMMRKRDANSEELVALEQPGESGWDNAKRYVQSSELFIEESPMMTEGRRVQSPDFNTYIYLGKKIIAKIADETGNAKIAKEYNDKAVKTRTAIESMWDKDAGLYRDRFEDDHQKIPVDTPGGIIPLLMGELDSEKIDKIVDSLTDPKRFWTKYPVTTMSMEDPDYNADEGYFSYWNGRVWPQINWLIIEGLCRSNKFDVAKLLSKLSIRMCNASGAAWCMENYHPETGEPYIFHNCMNYVWGGIFNDILLRRVMGIQPNAPKDELYINPLLNEDISMLSIKEVRVGTHTLAIEEQVADNQIELKFTHEGDTPITLITSEGRLKVHNETVNLLISTFAMPHWLE